MLVMSVALTRNWPPVTRLVVGVLAESRPSQTLRLLEVPHFVLTP